MFRRTAPLVAITLLLLAAAPAHATPGAGAAAQSYIVTLDDAVPFPGAVGATHAARLGGQLGYVYQHALRGYSISLPAGAAAALARMPGVLSVEADGVATTATTQTNATWGLDRIDQRLRPLSGTYSYTNTGTGVKAYIIDTGIRFSHNEFVGGRAISGRDTYSNDDDSSDCNGHGTHVAGTVGGSTWGVAKGVTLVGVRVLSCSGSGSWSQVIAGMDWVTGDHQNGPAVANMSLGGGANSSVDAAVNRMIDDGITVAVAAGNGNMGGRAQNACNYSPARVPRALTIGATNSSDQKASWSNYGTCLDMFAPGVSITSAWYTSNTATNTISGTSMATPHVAGVAALFLQDNPDASPADVASELTSNATTGVVSSAGSGSPNRLLFTDY